VPDHPGRLALEYLGLAGLLDVVLAQPHLQVRHVVPAQAVQIWAILIFKSTKPHARRNIIKGSVAEPRHFMRIRFLMYI
jgi:hypothetical protein